MLKKRRNSFNSFIFSGAITEIILLISMTIAFSVLMSESVNAEDPPNPTLITEEQRAGLNTALDKVSNPASIAGTSTSGIKNTITYTSKSGAIMLKNGKELTSITVRPDGTSIATYKGGDTQPLAAPVTKETLSNLKGDLKLEGQKETTIFGTTFHGGYAHLVQGVQWALLAAGAIQLIGTIAGLDKSSTNSLTLSAVGGIMAGKIVGSLGANGFGATKGASLIGGNFGNWITGKWGQITTGLVVAAVIFILTYSKEKKKTVTFECLPWEPPLGGAKCEQCNLDPFRPCTEYRCKSLGQACELVNAGTEKEQCTWVSKFDVNSPKITPWIEALNPTSLKYVPDTNVRPPALGTKIVTQSNGCLPAFTALKFGFTTDEPAQCKIDYNHTSKFDDMQYYVGGDNLYIYNHTQIMRLPGPASAESELSPLLSNDGTFSLYTRCRDANGNVNVDEYSFSYCVEQGPDTTPPRIEKTSILSGSPVQYNVDEFPIEVYVNEPAQCRWSTQSKAYEDMENSFSCATDASEINADLLYTCSGKLTGVKDREENIYYFRCKDQPDKPENERYVMTQSYEFKLLGSQPLTIESILPNETITGSTTSVSVDLEVETSNGAEEGKAICLFSTSGAANSYVAMFETNSHLHKQTLSLENGTYNYFFRCVDGGGNSASGNTTFQVFVDTDAPKVTRVYRDEALKIVTDEDAECRYSLNNCNFNINEGLRLEYLNTEVMTSHYVDWIPGQNYYIRCKDKYDNQPDPSTCSIIARPTEFSSAQSSSGSSSVIITNIPGI